MKTAIYPTPYGIRVLLDEPQMKQAITVGVRYRLAAIRMGLKDAHRFRGEPWGTEIEGMGGELALALALGTPWDPAPVETLGLPDVAGFYQVKQTRYPNGKLILPRHVPGSASNVQGDTPYVLVTGTMPEYLIRGWIWGRDALQDRYLEQLDPNRGVVYAVPQSDLCSMDAIPRPGRINYDEASAGSRST